MSLYPLFLVAMFLAEEERVVSDYVVKIKDGTLTKVQPTENSSNALDLSGLGLRGLEPDAFDDLATLKNLSLANNSLSSIPRAVFSKLANLEHLSLAHNNISYFPVAFADLGNLKTLNISHNPVKKLRCSELSGLPKSSVVLTEGLNFSTIDMNVFERASEDFDVLNEDRAEEMAAKYNECFSRTPNKGQDTGKNMIKVCIEDGVLKLVEKLNKDEVLPSCCRRVKFQGVLALENMGISKFDKDWYRLGSDVMYIRLNLTDNEIVEVTPEMLNDLPAKIYEVDLSRNKIERLEKGVIRNQQIRTLRLDSNGISEIEDDAFAHTELAELYISSNLLRNMKFMRTLPKTIESIYLQHNRIEDISAGSFPNLDRLVYLHLDGNLIQELRTDSLLGLPNLFRLGLLNNRISRLQSGCFRHTPNLFSIILGNNDLTSFENGTFDGLEKVSDLDVSHNKLTNLKENFPNGLPVNLNHLKCGFNKIEKLERGTFQNVPRYQLRLEGNGISKIEQGAFNLPKLTVLILDKNNLTEFDRDLFQGLNNLKRLSLVDNGIERLPKGFARHLCNLVNLDLGLNPIKRLENGDLYGLIKKAKPMSFNRVYLDQVPVEAIEGGLFDDM